MKKRKTRTMISVIMTVIFLTGCEVYPIEFNENVITKEDNTIVLTVLAGQSTSDAGIEDMIDEVVKEEFPKVQLDWECVDWGEKFDSQLQGRFASGDAPDIIIGKAQDVSAYAVGNNLAPIRIEGMDRIQEQALQAVTVEDKVYGLPYNAWYQGVVYNKDVFAELQLEVPTTIEELQQITDELKAHEITPFAAHFQESWKVGNMTMQFLTNSVFHELENWGTLFRRGNLNFSNNKIIAECMKQNQYILENSWDDALIIDQYESDRRFAEGEAAMYLTGSWSLQSINQYDTDTNYGIFPYPNQEGDSDLIKETNLTFMISKTSPNQELSADILEKLLGNEKLMQEILDFTQTYSVVKDVDIRYESSIAGDVKWYEENGKVMDASIGNNQLIWNFQNALAVETLKWLQGKESLEEVLAYADKYREESSN